MILAGAALLATGMAAGPAAAADTVKIDLTRLLQAAYQAAADDPMTGMSTDSGRKADDIFSNTQLYIIGSTGADDGAAFNGRDTAAPTYIDRWVTAIGAGYTINLWTLGVEYSHLDEDDTMSAGQYQQDRLSLTGNYELSPGINLDGELGYSRIDSGTDNGSAGGSDVDHALEIGIGTNFTF